MGIKGLAKLLSDEAPEVSMLIVTFYIMCVHVCAHVGYRAGAGQQCKEVSKIRSQCHAVLAKHLLLELTIGMNGQGKETLLMVLLIDKFGFNN